MPDKTAFEITKTELQYGMAHTVQIIPISNWSQVHPPFSPVYGDISVGSRLRYSFETCLEMFVF